MIIRLSKVWRHRWNMLFGDPPELPFILSQANPDLSLAEKIHWLEQLIAWVRTNNAESGGFDRARMNLLDQLLEGNLQWKSQCGATLRSILIESSGVSLFAQVGLSQETGFIGEFIRRVSKKILPSVANENQLSQVFEKVFNSPSDADWIRNIPSELVLQIFSILIAEDATGGRDVKKSMSEDLLDALLILAIRVGALGLSSEIRMRTQNARVQESPFYKVNVLLQNFPRLEGLPGAIEECRYEISRVYEHIEASGVNVALVFKLETLESSLARIEVLARLLGRYPSETENKTIPDFLANLILENIKNNSLQGLVITHFHLLAKKIVERTGKSGEHYIARDRSEWFEMFASAFGGGLVTVLTTVNKFFIYRLEMAFFFEGLFSWFNYSGSFLIMQFLGFTLATKQPSATAPALAGKLKDSKKVDEFVNEVIFIVRSQFSAAVGNLGAVIPGCIIFGLIYRTVFHGEVLSEKEAHHVISSMHPFKTMTLFQGAYTGVLLWFSSVAGGWLENWVVFNQWPEALAKNIRLNNVFGAQRCHEFAKRCLHQTAAFGMNVVLGFMLAFSPVVGKFFGLPLEPKHVTLSAGSLSLAIVSLPFDMREGVDIGFACLGIFFIGLLNFGVSFILALAVAQRARDVESWRIRALLKAVRERFYKHPFAFLFASVKQSK